MLHARTVRSSLHVLLLAALLASFTITVQSPAPASADPGITFRNVTSQVDLSNAIRTPDGRVRVIVELSQPSLATYGGTITGLSATSPQAVGAPLNVNSAASLAYINYLKGVQDQFVQRLPQEAPSATENARFQVAINAMSLSISETEVPNLYQDSNVLHVYPDQMRTAKMDASLDLINAQAAWTLSGGRSTAGGGVKVADVDTGLRVANPMFSGAGFSMPAGYPKGFCADFPSDPAFQCNAKVIAARAITPDVPLAVEEVVKPLDIDGHGSHTAGTATGDIVTVAPWGLQISGVAPGAYLMVYKALYEAPDHSTAQGSDTMLVTALNDAVSDGANVINNSWGGGAGGDPASTVYNTLLHNITAAGTLVVFSAGNDGPSGGTIGCPGCVPDALTVAASTTDRTFVATVSVDSTTPAATIPANLQNIQGRSVLAASVSAPVVDLFVEGFTDPLACTALPAASLTGKIAIVKRGTCALVDKVSNAKAAGALGVVIRNVAGGAQTLPIIQPVIPTVHVSQTDGDALVAFLTTAKTAGQTVAMTLHGPAQRVTTEQPDVLADFSSVGPNGDPNYLKPDIAAPGVNILSALSPVFSGGTDPYFGFESGTSMAAPHVTGAAALMKALHPDWTPQQIKSALTTTAKRDGVFAPDGKTPAGVFNMGAGRLDLGQASKAGVVFNFSSYASGNCLVTCTWKDTIKNVTSDTVTWNAVIAAAPTLHLSVTPASFTLPPGLSGDFTVTASGLDVSTTNWSTASITWTPSVAKYSPAYQPVAILGGTASNPFAFNMTGNKSIINSGDTITYTATVNNLYPSKGTFYFNNPLPAGVTYVDGSATGGLTYDPTGKKLTATIPLAGIQASVQSTGATPAFVDISADPNTTILNQFCTANCVDETVDITGVDFIFMGKHYTKIGMSTNGYLMAGGSTSTTGTNQSLPDPAAPNNVIAPFWTRLTYPTGTGAFMFGGDATHTIYEWKNVATAAAPANLYTFEVIVTDGTAQIAFAYNLVHSVPLEVDATVGIENDTGTVGANFYSKIGATTLGALPSAGQALAVNVTVASQTLTYQAKVTAAFNQGKVVNIATVTNSINSDVQTGIAQSPFLVFRSWMPVLKVNSSK
jgi:minor extracellular serine protease Vpr